MADAPDALVAMRLADMTKMHPAQDESRTCAECGWRVAIYPSGQRALRDFPEMRIMCSRCVFDKGDPAALNIACAPLEEIEQERRESYDVGQA